MFQARRPVLLGLGDDTDDEEASDREGPLLSEERALVQRPIYGQVAKASVSVTAGAGGPG